MIFYALGVVLPVVSAIIVALVRLSQERH